MLCVVGLWGNAWFIRLSFVARVFSSIYAFSHYILARKLQLERIIHTLCLKYRRGLHIHTRLGLGRFSLRRACLSNIFWCDSRSLRLIRYDEWVKKHIDFYFSCLLMFCVGPFLSSSSIRTYRTARIFIPIWYFSSYLIIQIVRRNAKSKVAGWALVD